MSEPIIFTEAPISVFQSTNMNGKPSRRVLIRVKDLGAIPDELFAVKISQSKKPELTGHPIFRYFSFKVSEDTPFSPLAPTSATLQTPTAELKAQVVENLGKMAGAIFHIAINMNGRFGNIRTPEGIYTLFDDQQFPQSEGKPGYYLKSNTKATVTLTKSISHYGPYYRVVLETTAMPNDIFVKSGRSKVWGAEDVSNVALTPTSAAPAAADNAGVASDPAAATNIW